MRRDERIQLGREVEEALETLGLSQREFAFKVGVASSTVARIIKARPLKDPVISKVREWLEAMPTLKACRPDLSEGQEPRE